VKKRAYRRRTGAGSTEQHGRPRPRIITGTARGRRLFVPRGNPETRPILDRIKTAVFNILGPGFPYISVLDLFAGAGSLGLEAASRGAALVVMVETDPSAVQALRRNASETRLEDAVEIVRRDAFSFLASDARTYDLVFLDPPFSWSQADRIRPLVSAALQRLAVGGCIVLRIPAVAAFSDDGLVMDRRRYGASAVLFISRKPQENARVET